MAAFALLPLVWILVVAGFFTYQIRKFRAKGMAPRQAFEEAMKASAVKRAPLVKTSPAMLNLFGLIGMISMLAGVWIFISTAGFIRGAAHSSGQIIDFARHHSSKGGDTFSPVVRFQTSSGQLVIFKTRFSSHYSAWPPQGSQVDVFYDPQNPHRARLNHFMELWFAPIFLFIFGGAFLGVSMAAAKNRRAPVVKEIPPSAPPPATPPPGYDIPTIIR